MLPHYPEKLKCSNLLHVWHIKLCSKKCSYQTHGGNFIIFQPIIKISWTILWVCGLPSWLRTRSVTRSTFSSVRALHGLPLPVSRLTVLVSLNFFSSLLMLFFVHRLFGNSHNNSVALYPFNWYKFLIKILSSLLKTMFANTAVTSAIPQTHEVVRQHILGVVSNVIHCFVVNLTDFPAVKEFC